MLRLHTCTGSEAHVLHTTLLCLNGRLGSRSNAILGDKPSLPRVNPGVADKAGALRGLPRDRQIKPGMYIQIATRRGRHTWTLGYVRPISSTKRGLRSMSDKPKLILAQTTTIPERRAQYDVTGTQRGERNTCTRGI